jgi:hypothetical protein
LPSVSEGKLNNQIITPCDYFLFAASIKIATLLKPFFLIEKKMCAKE